MDPSSGEVLGGVVAVGPGEATGTMVAAGGGSTDHWTVRPERHTQEDIFSQSQCNTLVICNERKQNQH